jgi:hypothetical protein
MRIFDKIILFIINIHISDILPILNKYILIKKFLKLFQQFELLLILQFF